MDHNEALALFKVVEGRLNKLYKDNDAEYESFLDYPFIKRMLRADTISDISTDRQKNNGTLKLLFKHTKRMGPDKGKEVEITLALYPLSGNVIRDDKTYVYQGTPGFSDKRTMMKKFIQYMFFKFLITPEESQAVKLIVQAS